MVCYKLRCKWVKRSGADVTEYVCYWEHESYSAYKAARLRSKPGANLNMSVNFKITDPSGL